jgi:DNA (cytosine-5)-methyltransferase 1
MSGKKIRVLNLYAGLGGNRYKWDEVANIEVTAIELDDEIARAYQERFPNDKVIVADAHSYLLNHYKEYDFIWSSPPCPSHSRIRITQKSRGTFIPLYPDMKLYEEIIFLDNHFDGKYCVENVIPYYEPLIQGQKRGRHIYWTNFKLPNDIGGRKLDGIFCTIINEHKKLEEFHDLKIKANLGGYRDVLRNLVDYEAGKIIFAVAMGIIQKPKNEQLRLINFK